MSKRDRPIDCLFEAIISPKEFAIGRDKSRRAENAQPQRLLRFPSKALLDGSFIGGRDNRIDLRNTGGTQTFAKHVIVRNIAAVRESLLKNGTHERRDAFLVGRKQREAGRLDAPCGKQVRETKRG